MDDKKLIDELETGEYDFVRYGSRYDDVLLWGVVHCSVPYEEESRSKSWREAMTDAITRAGRKGSGTR